MAQQTRRKLTKLIDAAVIQQPLNRAFLTDLMSAIEQRDLKRQKMPSQYYKPSSFVCMRQMYFIRIGEKPDLIRSEYTSIGMADTGTRRHEAIQEVLLWMNSQEYDWEYVDVEEYLKMMQSQGKCTTVKVMGRRGAETKLFDSALGLSYMCDGIILHKPTQRYILFEFKNQISFKFSGKACVDNEHVDQVSIYCATLELDYALVTYENRDDTSLECPELFHVTPEMKQASVDKIMVCEGYVERLVPPPPHTTNKPCRWCKYQTACRKAGK